LYRKTGSQPSDNDSKWLNINAKIFCQLPLSDNYNY
jgi:hypothetical protein